MCPICCFFLFGSLWLFDTIDTGDVCNVYRCACAYELAHTGTHAKTQVHTHTHKHTSTCATHTHTHTHILFYLPINLL
jgi:hypothetical protein